LAAATSSAVDLMGVAALTASSIGPLPISDTGTNALTGS
jgi:hypothetical protein